MLMAHLPAGPGDALLGLPGFFKLKPADGALPGLPLRLRNSA